MTLHQVYDRIKELLPPDPLFRKRLTAFLHRQGKEPADRPLVLIWELGGFAPILRKNAIFATALSLRGYRPHFVVCDGLPGACMQRGLEQNEELTQWSRRCSRCLGRMKKISQKYALEISQVSSYVEAPKREEFARLAESIAIGEILKYQYQGVKVGELAWSSTNRYMKGYIVEESELREEDQVIYRRYFYAGLINAHAAAMAIDKLQPVSILDSHGVYVDYAPPISLGFAKGIKSVSWASGFADFMHYFTIPKAADKLELRGITEVEWRKRAEQPLSESESRRLDQFMYNRYFKGKAIDIDISSLPEETAVLRRELGIDNDNPTVCLFTHINWDACFDLSTMIFDTANQWVVESIRKMAEITEVNWIIRIHPGEKTDGSLYTTDDVIRKHFDSFPSHIKVIWSDSAVNAYGLYRMVDAGITIFGTCGVELSLLGKPVIIAGNAHFSGKGFAIEAQSREEYFAILEKAGKIAPLTPQQVQLARQYAYSYFVQRQIPVDVVKGGHWGDLDLDRLPELVPGGNPVIDSLCEGILNGKDVILSSAMLEGR